MKSKKDRVQSKGEEFPASRRKFLKQSVAFAALTAGYSVISLTDLACSSTSRPGSGGLGNYYFGEYYFGEYYFEGGNDYFEGGSFFYY